MFGERNYYERSLIQFYLYYNQVGDEITSEESLFLDPISKKIITEENLMDDYLQISNNDGEELCTVIKPFVSFGKSKPLSDSYTSCMELEEEGYTLFEIYSDFLSDIYNLAVGDKDWGKEIEESRETDKYIKSIVTIWKHTSSYSDHPDGGDVDTYWELIGAVCVDMISPN